MTDLEYQRTKDQVKAIAEKWIEAAGLTWWVIDLDWSRTLKDAQDGPDDTKVMAETSTSWQYRQARITFYLPLFLDEDPWKQERTVVHELSHILVGSMQNFSTDEDRQMTEFAVECVTRALMWTAQNMNGLATEKMQEEAKSEPAE